MDKLEQIRYDGWELVIDVTGGGVADHLPRGLSARLVAIRLRELADRLDRNVDKRIVEDAAQ